MAIVDQYQLMVDLWLCGGMSRFLGNMCKVLRMNDIVFLHLILKCLRNVNMYTWRERMIK